MAGLLLQTVEVTLNAPGLWDEGCSGFRAQEGNLHTEAVKLAVTALPPY